MTTLVDGQNLVWPGFTLRVELRSERQCDLSALILGPDSRVRNEADFVFYNQPQTPGITWRPGPPQELEIELALITGASVVALLSVDPGEPELAAGALALTLLNETGEVARYSPQLRAGERAVTALEVYQRAGAWKVRAFGQGYASGLAELLGAHGVDVVDEQPAEPSPNLLSSGDPDTDDELSQRRLVQQTVGILEDLRNSAASFASTKDYAESVLIRELDELAGDPRLRHGVEGDQRRAAARGKHDDLIARARANHERDLAQLHDELDRWQTKAPAPMVAWSAPQWRQWQPVNTPVHSLTVGSLAPWQAPSVQVPLLIAANAPFVLWIDTESERENAPLVLRALVARVLACHPPGTIQVQVISELTGLLHPLGGPTCRVQPQPAAGTPDAIRAMLSQLGHDHDLAAMAAEAGIETDQPSTLLVITDLTLLPDLACARQLAQLANDPGTIVLVAASESDDLAIATPAQIFDACHRFPCATPKSEPQEEASEWIFSVDVGDDQVVTDVLARLGRV